MAIEVKTDGNLSPEDIKSLRLSLGWTQQHFAEMLGTALSSVSKWENGKSEPLPVYQKKLRELNKKKQSDGNATTKAA